MTTLNRKLLTSDVEEIKRRLYAGDDQADIAAAFSITQPHVSRILHGKVWPEVPWPDGATGAADYRKVVTARDDQNTQALRTQKTSVLSRFKVVANEPPPMRENVTAPDVPVPDIPAPRSAEQELGIDTNSMDWREAVDRLGEELQAQATDELEAAILVTSPAPQHATVHRHTAIPLDSPMLEWSEVLARASDVPIVVRACEVPMLRPAVRMVFAQVSPRQWASSNTERLVLETANRMDDLNPGEPT